MKLKYKRVGRGGGIYNVVRGKEIVGRVFHNKDDKYWVFVCGKNLSLSEYMGISTAWGNTLRELKRKVEKLSFS